MYTGMHRHNLNVPTVNTTIHDSCSCLSMCMHDCMCVCVCVCPNQLLICFQCFYGTYVLKPSMFFVLLLWYIFVKPSKHTEPSPVAYTLAGFSFTFKKPMESSYVHIATYIHTYRHTYTYT